MFGFGIWELLIILIIIVVLFSRKLPDIGEGIGKGIRSFRKAIREPDEIDITPDSEQKKENGDKRQDPS